MDRTVHAVIESVLNEQRQEMSRSLVLALQSRVGAASLNRNAARGTRTKPNRAKRHLNWRPLKKVGKNIVKSTIPNGDFCPIPLPSGFEPAPPVLAVGSELAAPFCLVNQGQAILSPYSQPLVNADTFYRHHQRWLSQAPAAIALDAHADDPATQLGEALAAKQQLPIHAVQAHHAQVAACMVAHQLPLHSSPILGISLDGLSYGDDDTLWGGEFLLADYQGFRRLATFKPIALIGGDQAAYQPWHSTYAHLVASFDWDDVRSAYGELDILRFIAAQPRDVLNQMVLNSIHAPRASSCGRLFDAVAAAVGICGDRTTCEGQTAAELATLVDAPSLAIAQESPYGFTIQWLHRCTDRQLPYIEPLPMWWQILEDLQQQVPASVIAARFQVGLARAIADMAHHLSQDNPIERVALTGGVFQNQVLLTLVSQCLSEMGFTVLAPNPKPSRQEEIALGQGAIAVAQILNGGRVQ